MRRTAWLGLLIGLAPALGHAGEAPPKIDASLGKALEAVEKATGEIKSLQADYHREYTVFGRTTTVTEAGRFWWKRDNTGKIRARWEGRDEKGPLIRLQQGREITRWRGTTRESTTDLDDATVHHEARFRFPLLPAAWRETYRAGPPWISPLWDDRLPKRLDDGIPYGAVFLPRDGKDRTFKRVTLLLDRKTGLAYRYRCDTHGWQHVIADLENWTINPEIPDVRFEPPGEKAKEPGSKTEKEDRAEKTQK